MKQTVFAMIAAASLFIGATSCSQQPCKGSNDGSR